MEKIICFAKIAYSTNGIIPIRGESVELKECELKEIENDEITFEEKTGQLDNVLDSIVESDEIFIVEINPLKRTATEIITKRTLPLVMEGKRYEFDYNTISCQKQTKIVSNLYPISSFFLVHMLENNHNRNFSYPAADEYDLNDYLKENKRNEIDYKIDEYKACGKMYYEAIKDYLNLNDTEITLIYNDKIKVRRKEAN